MQKGANFKQPKACAIWLLDCLVYLFSGLFKSGLGSVRPAGHMQPAKYLNVVRELLLNFIT